MPTGIYNRTKAKLNSGMFKDKHIVSEEIRKQLRENHKGKHNSPVTEFKKGQISWRKGKSCSEITKEKLSQAHLRTGHKPPSPLGRHHTEEWKENMREITLKNGNKPPINRLIGEDNPNWKGGITPLHKAIRNLVEYKQWRSNIFQRDYWTCRTCGSKYQLEAHHIESFAQMLKENNIMSLIEAQLCNELWEAEGVTLCNDCHKLTKNYGNKKCEKSTL